MFRVVAVAEVGVVLLACRAVVVTVCRCVSIQDWLVVVEVGWREKPLLFDTIRANARIRATNVHVVGMLRGKPMVGSYTVRL